MLQRIGLATKYVRMALNDMGDDVWHGIKNKYWWVPPPRVWVRRTLRVNAACLRRARLLQPTCPPAWPPT